MPHGGNGHLTHIKPLGIIFTINRSEDYIVPEAFYGSAEIRWFLKGQHDQLGEVVVCKQQSQVLTQTVATPIEQQVNGVERLLYMCPPSRLPTEDAADDHVLNWTMDRMGDHSAGIAFQLFDRARRFY
jgi:hypothetical protein